MGDEAPRFFQVHTGTMGIALKVQNQQGLVSGANNVQKVLYLLHSVATGPEMVGAPQKSCIKSLSHVRVICRIGVTSTLCCLVDYSENATSIYDLREV